VAYFKVLKNIKDYLCRFIKRLKAERVFINLKKIELNLILSDKS